MNEVRQYTVNQCLAFYITAQKREKAQLSKLATVVRAGALADDKSFKKFMREMSSG